ncbi:RNA polymerase sigma factor SigL [Kitasatospora cheerisanensis KCTC 2395]|uniref:RNA polymerase sigma factor n=2 Tax=Kitasatospora cheerisanensis TaxID=81942 RepID=A0A066Z794_9ACTN|nr:sigma-70 family RNA polymerase sigma factor [Kitasatospora cheerisanensis]KDN86055.1 RNA polymerase sigma factor SigL [Kitasatospora cheerisanensis KCTC 2395]
MADHPRPTGHDDAAGPAPGRTAGPDAEDRLMRALYREHARPLYGMVLHLVGGDRQRAEDVVQETLVRAWRHLDRLDTDHRDLRPWLATVARRIVIDGRRGQRARPREVPDGELERFPAEDELDRVLRLMTLTDALGSLSEAHRRAITETYLRGRTAAEAATVLGVPPGTVRSRLYYALRALRLALEERGVTP